MISELIIDPQDLSKRWIDRMANNGLDILGIHSEGGKEAYKFVFELEELVATKGFESPISYI